MKMRVAWKEEQAAATGVLVLECGWVSGRPSRKTNRGVMIFLGE